MDSPRSSLFLLLFACAPAALAQPGAPTNSKVSFAREVAPIISSKCYHCHGQDEHSRKAKLRLDLREEAILSRDGTRAIVPGKPQESALIERILSKDQDEVMPPPKEGHAVTAAEVETLRKWIAQGAEYEGHWAFRAPRLPEVPKGGPGVSVRNPVDAFIAAALRTEGLAQNPEADSATLLRRVSLDLTGLPPSPAEVAAYEADKSADRLEKAVDRLLASPHFGEKWARPWLDLARYADSTGYGSDRLRLNIWPYRDWVIRALNENKPFDQFSKEQIAGDLLPNASRDQIVATAFHRNTMTQTEGGTDREEYRVAAVKDRVATTMQAWMGLTAGCAQCHSHKFDPITHKEYYQLFAIFNQTEDADRSDEFPLLPLPTPEQTQKLEQIQSEITALEAELRKPSSEVDREQTAWEAEVRVPVAWRAGRLVSGTSRAGAIREDSEGTLVVDLAAGQKAPKTQTYTLTFEAPEFPVTGLRVEILPEAESKSTYRLTELVVEALPAKDAAQAKGSSPAKATRLPVKFASSDITVQGSGAEKAIDNDGKTGWSVPAKEVHAAAFELAKPSAGRPLQVTLKLDDPRAPAFGKFRISFTDRAGLVRELPAAIRDILAVEAADRNPKQKTALAAFFRPLSAYSIRLSEQVAAKRAELAANKPVELPIMKENPGMRASFVFNKGNYLTPGEPVEAGLPASFHPATAGAGNRLALAEWIFSRENPLTARVAVNRFWSQIFGMGLVETEEDFGTQGSWPSHPELLDWLALHFQTPKAEGGLGWDTKGLLKLLVTSHTYRQSSKASALAQQKDPRNVLLSHYTRRRLEAEAIRDQALAVSGLLSPRLGGPSVYPPQPDGLWMIAFRGVEKYPTSTGEDRWRRSLYTVWRRIAPNPTMATFDAPTRESCTLRRVPTNTPLQAFVTLNDPVYVEAAQAMARRILKESPASTPEERLRFGLTLALQRKPSATQVDALRKLLDAELVQYRADSAAAKRLGASSQLPLPADADAAELAAWTAVANVLLNLDGFLTKS